MEDGLFEDARLSESERQKYNRLVSIKIYKMNYCDKLTGGRCYSWRSRNACCSC